MSLKKQNLKSKSMCKVTFKFTGNEAKQAQEANLAGDFNDWNPNSIPMKKLKDGSFSTSLNLEANQEYRFRYVSSNGWYNDDSADNYIHCDYADCENCIVKT